jgi:hypothetical protein
MRKQTAPQIQKRRPASSRKQPGLMTQSLHAQPSATPDSALDNHSHRTSNYADGEAPRQHLLSCVARPLSLPTRAVTPSAWAATLAA